MTTSPDLRTWLLLTGVPPTELLDIARAAEERGFHGIAMGDHLAMPAFDPSEHPTGKAPFDDQSPFPDVFTAFAAMAAVTRELRFVSYVYVAALRHPLSVAKQLATASDISGGRVALGVGTGWLEPEFERLAQPYSHRGARTDEIITILRQAWDTGVVDHRGAHYTIPRSTVLPRPVHPIPVYVGGAAGAAQDRAIRNDGWLSLRSDATTLRSTLDALGERRSDAGADGPFRIFAAAGAGAPSDFTPLTAHGLTDLVVPLWWTAGDRTPDERLEMIRDYDPDRTVPAVVA